MYVSRYLHAIDTSVCATHTRHPGMHRIRYITGIYTPTWHTAAHRRARLLCLVLTDRRPPPHRATSFESQQSYHSGAPPCLKKGGCVKEGVIERETPV
mmetsp:Transcript_4311/g.11357  ORF Transcript_4311/g.11357 Transcript_4311/m.11357 type:complete len:98 (+) Transcript_4311:1501-1794(+)